MPGYQRMLFVCLNDRGDEHPRGSCAKAGGGEVLDRLRAGIHERGLKGVVRAVGTRCLDDHVLGGEVVAALELSEEQLVFVSREERPLPPIQRRKGVAAAPSDQESDPAPGAEGA